jgi:hypothetical protein
VPYAVIVPDAIALLDVIIVPYVIALFYQQTPTFE